CKEVVFNNLGARTSYDFVNKDASGARVESMHLDIGNVFGGGSVADATIKDGSGKVTGSVHVDIRPGNGRTIADVVSKDANGQITETLHFDGSIFGTRNAAT